MFRPLVTSVDRLALFLARGYQFPTPRGKPPGNVFGVFLDHALKYWKVAVISRLRPGA
jgi:hypothetical protein